MHYEPQVAVGPVVEPILLEEARAAIHFPSDDDTLVEDVYIPAARRVLERATGRSFTEQTLRINPSCFPGCRYIELPRATPLIGIVGVTLKDSEGAETTWDAAEYIADTSSMPGRLVLGYNKNWPSFTKYPVSPISILYEAGESTYPTDAVDQRIKTAMLLLVGSLYSNRESEVMAEKIAAQTVEFKHFRDLISGLRVVHEFSEI